MAEIYVTQSAVAIDRCASAWFIKRFIDVDAIFVFFEIGQKPPSGIGFGFYGAPYFNKGRDCTFTALVRAAGKENVVALQKMNDLVNDTLAWRQGPQSLANRLRMKIDDCRRAVKDDESAIGALFPAFDLLYLSLGGDIGSMKVEAADEVLTELPGVILANLSLQPTPSGALPDTMDHIRQSPVPIAVESFKELFLLMWDEGKTVAENKLR